jgi:hypothetical protein
MGLKGASGKLNIIQLLNDDYVCRKQWVLYWKYRFPITMQYNYQHTIIPEKAQVHFADVIKATATEHVPTLGMKNKSRFWRF